MEYGGNGRIPRNTAEPLHSMDRYILRASTVESASVVERITKTEAELAVYQKGDGVFTKPNVISNAKTLAPAMWWATYCKHLPLLSSVARRVLAQPVCASAAERNWSVYGQIKRRRGRAWATPWATSLYFATRPST